MTLPEILARLEAIERLEAWCLRCDMPCTDNDRREAIVALRLDIERHLLKVGQL